MVLFQIISLKYLARYIMACENRYINDFHYICSQHGYFYLKYLYVVTCALDTSKCDCLNCGLEWCIKIEAKENIRTYVNEIKRCRR